MNTYLKQIIVVASVLLFTGSLSFAGTGSVKTDLMATKAHPNGNPADMKNMVGALKAKL